MDKFQLEQQISELKSLYRSGSYQDVLYRCDHLMDLYGRQQSLVWLKRMALFKLSLHRGHFAHLALILAVTFMAFGLAVGYERIAENLLKKDLQISVLIDEVGSLKQSNLELLKSLIFSRKDVDYLSSQISLAGNKQAFEKATSEKLKVERLVGKIEPVLPTQTEEVFEKGGFKEAAISALSENKDLISFLLLGRHAGLTDTILVAVVNPLRNKVSTISIPRDLYLNGRKINEFYAKFGIENMIGEVEKVLGIRLNYYAVIDIETFASMVDILEGIEVDVERDLVDALYPGPDNSYQTFSIKAGLQKMDGVTALKYVRSRKSTSDFDRAARQQNVLKSIKQRFLELEVMLNPLELSNLYSAVFKGFESNLDLLTGLNFFRAYKDYEIQMGNVLSTGNLLYSTYNQKGQYILLPSSGDYTEIQAWAAEVVN